MVFIHFFNLFNFGFIKLKILTPLNKLWAKFGIFLGKIISPIIMGIIFFCSNSNRFNYENFRKGYLKLKI